MAKSSKAQSDFGDDVNQEVPAAEVATVTEELNPSMVELLAGPKTLPTGGEGTGGRPWVYCVTKERGQTLRQPQQGDQVRPMCPMCSNDQVAVLCTAASSPSHGQTFTTRYKCPKCNFSAQKLRPGALQQLQGRGMTPNAPFVERS